VHELNAWAEHETADVADQRALLNQLSCRLGALAAAVAELPQVFSESVAGLVEAHESMRGEIQMMRAQWRDERAASREAVAILRALIDDASDSARVTALTARVQALEAASAAGIRPSSPSAAAEQAATALQAQLAAVSARLTRLECSGAADQEELVQKVAMRQAEARAEASEAEAEARRRQHAAAPSLQASHQVAAVTAEHRRLWSALQEEASLREQAQAAAAAAAVSVAVETAETARAAEERAASAERVADEAVLTARQARVAESSRDWPRLAETSRNWPTSSMRVRWPPPRGECHPSTRSTVHFSPGLWRRRLPSPRTRPRRLRPRWHPRGARPATACGV